MFSKTPLGNDASFNRQKRLQSQTVTNGTPNSNTNPLDCVALVVMRRRKKDKAMEEPRPTTSEDSLENSGRGRSTKADALSRSPPQQRKRSLLGLSSMRDLVEQVGKYCNLNNLQSKNQSQRKGILVGSLCHELANLSSERWMWTVRACFVFSGDRKQGGNRIQEKSYGYLSLRCSVR